MSVEGVIRVREHCEFLWIEPRAGARRVAEVRASHCCACVAELRRLGFALVGVPVTRIRAGSVAGRAPSRAEKKTTRPRSPRGGPARKPGRRRR